MTTNELPILPVPGAVAAFKLAAPSLAVACPARFGRAPVALLPQRSPGGQG
jgi:hypothetical protein